MVGCKWRPMSRLRFKQGLNWIIFFRVTQGWKEQQRSWWLNQPSISRKDGDLFCVP